ncbi:hypothetical protein B0T17DRAFT_247788 [Bombardia bombarda]|uniref:MADS-box MEF2 type transcription factor MIG1 n=1 Tax=Bombardia bombarda TaxID=252184 RepID=A0AA40C426_9PEZI|nr:hypothetical protein B0T17DRAFT_247788 [Bombardia bombarda]
MGRRKIEIKAIKDDRNRSVTFLKRKGGLFKKAHELSVLCSVDVAVFIFGSNKKLYEYSSCDMRDLITRYTYHGGPNEHKGPSDFNGGADDDDDDDENGTPPQGDVMEQMLPPHFQGPPSFPHIRHHTPSASPPIPNGVFSQHPGHPGARGHTPQPQIGSRPSSRNDIRRMGPNMVGQAVGPQGPPQPPPVNGFAFMPQPAIYNPQNPPNMAHNMPPHSMPQQHPQYVYHQQQQQQHPQQPHQMQPYMEDQRRASQPNYPPQPQGPPAPRHSASPPQPPPSQVPQQVSQQPMARMSPPPPQPQLLHPMRSPNNNNNNNSSSSSSKSNRDIMILSRLRLLSQRRNHRREFASLPCLTLPSKSSHSVNKEAFSRPLMRTGPFFPNISQPSTLR